MAGSFYKDENGWHIEVATDTEAQSLYALWLVSKAEVPLTSADWPAELGTLSISGPRGMRDIRRAYAAERQSPEA